jgi:PKD repeat protein
LFVDTKVLQRIAWIVGLLILSQTSCKKDDVQPAPVAAFKFTIDTYGYVTFVNSSTNAASYAWDYGDGTTSTDMSPNHQYRSYGNFTVRLTGTGPGGSSTSSQVIEVINPLIGSWIMVGYGVANCLQSPGALFTNRPMALCPGCFWFTFTASTITYFDDGKPEPYTASANTHTRPYGLPDITFSINADTLTEVAAPDTNQDNCVVTVVYTKR